MPATSDINRTGVPMTTAEVEAWLRNTEQKDLLRFLTCGSVDDGKSTLIGRLLHDTHNVYVDHQEALERDSARIGNAGGEIDYSLLLDGLEAEREQGITIDVAYRYFTTAKRKFIIADTPGHEQYTRNMATGASTADLAIVLIDARHGVLPQTRRHSYIATLLNIRHVLVAVNKMDLVAWSQERFDEIVKDYQQFATGLPRTEFTFIPVSALKGENVVDGGPSMPWYEGPTVIEHLEQVQVKVDRNMRDLAYPVQLVIRPNLDFRGFAGTVASGVIRKGQQVTALPSGKSSTVKSITTFDGELDEAFPPMSVVVTLNDEIDVSRGDVLVADPGAVHVGTHFEAMLVWMNETALKPGREYLVKQLCSTVPGKITEVIHRVDINNLDQVPADKLAVNEIGKVVLQTSRPLTSEVYRKNRYAGAFIIIDRMTNNTVGAGMITDHLAVEADVTKRLLNERNVGDPVTAEDRAGRFNQRPASVWLSGVPSDLGIAVARIVEQQLFDEGYLSYVLDLADLSVDMQRVLGFSSDEKLEDLRRAVSLSRLVADAGLVAIAVVGDAIAEEGEQLKVYIDTNPLHASGTSKVIKGERPAVTLETRPGDEREVARRVVEELRRLGIIGFYRGDDIISI